VSAAGCWIVPQLEGHQGPMMVSVSPFFGFVLALVIPGALVILLVCCGPAADAGPPLSTTVDCREACQAGAFFIAHLRVTMISRL
jgi:hypothetical protein